MVDVKILVIIFSIIITLYSFRVNYSIHKSHNSQLNTKMWFVSKSFLFLTVFYYAFHLFAILNNYQTISVQTLSTFAIMLPAILVLCLSHYFQKTIEVINKRNLALNILRKELQQSNLELGHKVKERTQKLEKSHQRALKKEKQLQELKDEFVFIAAHELRNPITAIKWQLELLKDSHVLKSLSSEQKQILQEIEQDNQQLISLVNNLLSVARIENKKNNINISEIKPNKVIEQSISENKLKAKKKNIEIKTKFDKKIPLIKSDSVLLHEGLTNIITNSIKYTQKNGKIEIISKLENDKIAIKICDNGIGMTKAEIKNLFKKFFRSTAHSVQKQSGTGLGLYITKKIINNLGGTITADSAGLNKGTCFEIKIPVR